MPGFDGTGPGGMGPRTGRGLGFCGGGYGYGRGMGGRGFGRGFGWGYSPWGYTPYSTPRVTKKEEKEILEGDLEAIQEEMNDIKARLDELKGE